MSDFTSDTKDGDAGLRPASNRHEDRRRYEPPYDLIARDDHIVVRHGDNDPRRVRFLICRKLNGSRVYAMVAQTQNEEFALRIVNALQLDQGGKPR